MPLETHLDFIADKALKGVKKAEPLPSIPRQKRYSAPITKTISYPMAKDEESEDKNDRFICLADVSRN